MSNQFYVLLPSNTPGYPDNSPNKYRVHLPKPIRFDGSWVCGVHSIIYTHSWPTIGTTEQQWIEIRLKNGKKIRVSIPRYSYASAKQLEYTIQGNILKGIEENLNERRFQHVANLIEEKNVAREKKSTDLKGKNIEDPTRRFLTAIMGLAIKEAELESEKEEKVGEQIQIIGPEVEVSMIDEENKQKRLDKLKQTALEHVTVINESVRKVEDHIKEAKQFIEKNRETSETDAELVQYKNLIEKYYNKIDSTRKKMLEFYLNVVELKNKTEVAFQEKNLKKLRRYNKKLEYIRLAFTEEPTLIYGSGQWPIQLRRMGYLGFEYVIKDNSILISKMNEQITIRKKQIEIDRTTKKTTQIQEIQKDKTVSDSNKQVVPQVLMSQKIAVSDSIKTEVKEIDDPNKDQQELDLAKRVAFRIMEELSSSYEKITKYYNETNEIIKKIETDNPSNRSELERYSILINNLFYEHLTYYKETAQGLLETAIKSKQRVVNFFEEKNVQKTKLNTDEIKRIRANFLGEDTNGNEPTFPGFEQRAKEIRDRVLQGYNEQYLPIKNLQTIIQPSSKFTESSDENLPQALVSEQPLTESTKILVIPKSLTEDDSEFSLMSKFIAAARLDKNDPNDAEKIKQLHKQVEEQIIHAFNQPFVKGDYVHFPAELGSQYIIDLFQSIKFQYDETINKFTTTFNDREIDSILLAPQFAYIVGYGNGLIETSGQKAEYSFNLHGGTTSFCIYSKGLTENIIMGNELVSLLSVVAVTGSHGDTIEKIYDTPIYSRVLPKQIQEVEIEIRTLDGHLVPFQFGVTMICLVFKKVIVF